MSENRKKKSTGGTASFRKESKPAQKKTGRGNGEFRIGSRDILATPEILSPFEADESVKSRRGRKNELTPAPQKPAAPTHSRKGKKKAEESVPLCFQPDSAVGHGSKKPAKAGCTPKV